MADGAITVRNGSLEDLPGIVALERISRGAPHWGETVYRTIVAGALWRDETAAGPRRQLLIAEMGLDLAGFAVAAATGGGSAVSAELENILVAEGLRRRGVGRQLCAAVIAWARELEAETLDLEVRASSDAGRLYHSLGFRLVGRRPGYYRGPHEDALLMRLSLPRPG